MIFLNNYTVQYMEDFINNVFLSSICDNDHDGSVSSDYIMKQLRQYDITELWAIRHCLPTACDCKIAFHRYDYEAEDLRALYCTSCITLFPCVYYKKISYRFIYCKRCIKVLHYLYEKVDIMNCECEALEVLELQHICRRIDLQLFCDNAIIYPRSKTIILADEELDMLTATNVKSAMNFFE